MGVLSFTPAANCRQNVKKKKIADLKRGMLIPTIFPLLSHLNIYISNFFLAG